MSKNKKSIEPDEFPRRYSGEKSEKFWKVVDSLPKGKKGELYLLGCLLQNVESFVLNNLDGALYEQAASRKKKK